jgi:hypothetical protein
MRRVIRRLATTVLLVSAGSSLAACGSGGQAASATVTRAAATASVATGYAHAPGAAAKPLTKRQAVALAGAVNLTAADVPGFKVASPREHEHETPAEKRLERELLRCVGASSPNDQLAEVSSEEFGREDKGAEQKLQSSVSVERTAALAAKELATIRSARSRDCLSHYVDLLFKGEKYHGASLSPVSISSGSPSARGTTGSFAWRIKSAITLRGVRIPFSMDFVGFVYGSAEVTLFTFGLPEPLPAAMEERLFALLVERAEAHSV